MEEYEDRVDDDEIDDDNDPEPVAEPVIKDSQALNETIMMIRRARASLPKTSPDEADYAEPSDEDIVSLHHDDAEYLFGGLDDGVMSNVTREDIDLSEKAEDYLTNPHIEELTSTDGVDEITGADVDKITGLEPDKPARPSRPRIQARYKVRRPAVKKYRGTDTGLGGVR